MTTRIAPNIDWKNADWFCNGILDGSLPAERLFENDEVLAFVAPQSHRNKKYDVHALVIPKRHVETLLELDPSGPVPGALIEAVGAAARMLGLDQSGFFLRSNVLPPYQGTGHVHVHLLSGKRKKKKSTES
jgi:histidine triad (HIT) family protein